MAIIKDAVQPHAEPVQDQQINSIVRITELGTNDPQAILRSEISIHLSQSIHELEVAPTEAAVMRYAITFLLSLWKNGYIDSTEWNEDGSRKYTRQIQDLPRYHGPEVFDGNHHISVEDLPNCVFIWAGNFPGIVSQTEELACRNYGYDSGTVAGLVGEQEFEMGAFLECFDTFMEGFVQMRARHRQIYTSMLSYLSDDERATIQQYIPQLEQMDALNTLMGKPVWIAVPSPHEDEAFWKKFMGFSDSLVALISNKPWAKIYEYGVIYVDTTPNTASFLGGNNWPLYQLLRAITGQTDSLTAGYKETGSHEGSHFKCDTLCCYILELDENNLLYESIPEIIGESDRKNQIASVEFTALLESPLPEDSPVVGWSLDEYKYQCHYNAGPRLFGVLVQLCGGDDQAQESVVSTVIKAAISVRQSSDFKSLSPNEKVRRTLLETMSLLDLSPEAVQAAYEGRTAV